MMWYKVKGWLLPVLEWFEALGDLIIELLD